MKRFFDLSLLLLVPLFLIGSFGDEPATPEYSDQAHEIHALVADHVDMSVADIQEVLDNPAAFAMNAEMMCELDCNPYPGCCYGQGHLDRILIDFGCSGAACQWPCLDFNDDGITNTADLLILLANWCP